MRVQSIMFGPDSIQLGFQEDRDRVDDSGVILYTTIDIPTGALPVESADLHDSAQTLIDAALLLRRRPPESFSGTR